MTINAPKCFNGQFLGHPGISYKTHDPSVYFTLVLPKQPLKRVYIASRELLQHMTVPVLMSH